MIIVSNKFCVDMRTKRQQEKSGSTKTVNFGKGVQLTLLPAARVRLFAGRLYGCLNRQMPLKAS